MVSNMELTIKIDQKQLRARLGDIVDRQLPFATARALTQTAKQAQAAVRNRMTRVFDRPTAYTLNSTFVRPATRSRLSARVWLKDDAAKAIPPAKYLLPQVEGGGRRQKRSEILLTRAGILPDGWYLVPSKSVRLDGSGNVPRSLVVKIITDLRASFDVGTTSNRLTRQQARERGKRFRQSRFFVVRPGGRAQPGIYRRIDSAFGRAAQPVMIFTAQPQYDKRLDFFETVERSVREGLEPNFSVSLADAIRTAR